MSISYPRIKKIIRTSNCHYSISNDDELIHLICIPPASYVNIINCNQFNLLELTCDLNELELCSLPALNILYIPFNIYNNLHINNCINLTSIYFNNNTLFDRLYINKCNSLVELKLYNISIELTIIDCELLENIDIYMPNNINKLRITFNNCKNLKNIKILNNKNINELLISKCPILKICSDDILINNLYTDTELFTNITEKDFNLITFI